MQHLDEGTIHAWLDGALSAEEAARVERHAAECAQCAPVVAEARGLVAGASRILSALDDVEAVVPMAGGGGERLSALGSRLSVAPPAAHRVHVRRPRWSRPAALAAAASVVLMVGTAVVWTKSGGPSDRAVAVVAASDSGAAVADRFEGAARPSAEVAPANSPPGQTEGATAAAVGTAAPGGAGSQAFSGAATGVTDGTAGTRRLMAESASRATALAPRPAASRGVVGTASRDSLRTMTGRRASGAAEVAADAAAAPTRLETREAVVPPAAPPTPAPAAAANESPTAQRRFVGTPTLANVVVTGVGTDSARGRRGQAPASGAVAGAIAGGRAVPAAQKSVAAEDGTRGRTDSTAVARADSPSLERPEYSARRRPPAASALEPNRPMAPRGVFALAGCYTVVEGRGLPKLVTLDTTRFINTRRDEPRYVAHASRSIGYWTPEGLGEVRVGIAGVEIVARIEPPDGELRGTVRRGLKRERFVARRGCS